MSEIIELLNYLVGFGIVFGMLLMIVITGYFYVIYKYLENKRKARRRWLCESCKKKYDYMMELS